MFTRITSWGCLLLLCLTAAACSKSDNDPFYQATLEQLRGEDLAVGTFEPAAAKPYAAQACARGEVEKLDVLVCRYKDQGSAKKAASRVETFIGTALTGAVRRSGTQLLAVADREKTDPAGKHAQRILATFAPAGKDS